MKLSLIAAMDNSRVIGKDNQMPWHLPADLKYFKKVTLHKPIIMGRKTFESIGRVLPGRPNIVVTRNSNYNINVPIPRDSSVHCVASLPQAFDSLPSFTEEIFIIGGATLFEEALSKAEKLYLTLIKANFAGDTFFPAIDETHWQEYFREDHKADKDNPYDYSFIQLKRK